MAVTRKNQEPYQQNAQTTAAQQQMQQAQQNQPGAYQQSAGVQQAQQNLQNAQANKPATYTQGDSVTAAQQQLQNINASKPQGYESKYGAQLDSILQQIQNPKEFKYSFDGDELFKYYADLYTQKGKQASADAMGQAAALTGGYGNSYGQMVGNQAYDQYLLNLYDKGMDLRNAAYQQYSDQLANNYNIYNTLANADAADYNRYRDTVSDWQNERNFLTDYYNIERNFDYNKFRDTMADWQNEQNYLANRLDAERNYDYSLYRDQVNDWLTNRDYATNLYNNERNFDYGAYSDAANRAEQQYQYDASLAEQMRQNDLDEAYRQAQFAYTQQQDAKQFDENVRQFNESLNWDKMSAQQKYAAEYAMQILAMGQMPSAELLAQAGLSAEDAAKLMAQIAKSGGVSKKSTTNKDESMKDAETRVLQNTPLSAMVGALSLNKNDTRTLADLANAKGIDMARVATNPDLTEEQRLQALRNASNSIAAGVPTYNSAANYAANKAEESKAKNGGALSFDAVNKKLNQINEDKKPKK